MKYDISIIKERIKEIRLNRWGLYKKNKENINTIYKKYACCRTKETLADELEIDRRTLGSWERGKTLPSLENLISLCNLLDCNIEYFLGADEIPYIDTVAKASHFTGISPEIIKHSTDNSNYLDCLNYFMLPKNCATLFNQVTLSNLKNFGIIEKLSDINEPLMGIISNSYEEYYSFTAINEMGIDKYKEYIIKNIPKELVIFSSSKNNEFFINVKECLSSKMYKEFLSKTNSKTKYIDFIDYIAQYTFEPLQNTMFLELQRKKIAETFITLLNNYLSDI